MSSDSDEEDEGVIEESVRRRKKRRREVGGSESDEGGGGEVGASWEGVRSGGVRDDDDENVRYLLPLKNRGRLIFQPPISDPFGVCVC